MQKLLIKALRSAMSTLERHLKLVGGNNADEATFRSFLLAEIVRTAPKAKGQIEWHRFDLLLQHRNENALVEIKFYMPDRTIGLDGTPGNWKGGASLKNEQEFCKCVSKLKDTQNDIHHKFLILVYESNSERTGKHSFAKSYDDLTRFGVSEVHTIDHTYATRAVCKLIRIA
jgi:hypothetical protein